MGRQIRFYQTKFDEKSMFDDLSKMGMDVYVTYNVHITEKTLERVSELISYESLQNYPTTQLYITTASLYDGKSPLTNFFSKPGPAVEFCLCHKPNIAGGVIWHGRFWLDSVLYENKELVSLYNKLVKYVKKNYVYCPNIGAYMGKDAYEKWKNNEFNIGFSFEEFGN